MKNVFRTYVFYCGGWRIILNKNVTGVSNFLAEIYNFVFEYRT
jgi:hypothetical protein